MGENENRKFVVSGPMYIKMTDNHGKVVLEREARDACFEYAWDIEELGKLWVKSGIGEIGKN